MNLPKFMIRHTGGFAVGAISTKSRAASLAFWSASDIATMPSASPDSPIKRTSFQRICSFTRMLFLSILHLRDHLLLPSFECSPGVGKKVLDCHCARVAAMSQTHGNRSRGCFLLADHEHTRHLRELRLPDTRAQLLSAVVRFRPQARLAQSRGDLSRAVR